MENGTDKVLSGISPNPAWGRFIFHVTSEYNGTHASQEYHLVTVHDELLALCTQMHAEGAKLTYDAVRTRRGGGSKRDISKALLVWHQKRTRDLSVVALDLSAEVERLGAGFVRSLWSAMAQQAAEKLQEVRTEAEIVTYYADDEIAHLHGIIGYQLNEIDALKMQIKKLEEKLAIAPEAQTR